MRRGNERVCFEILKQILKDKYAPNEYYIGGVLDSAICIMENDEGWIVFQSERGAKNWETQHAQIEDACFDFLERIGLSRDGEKLKREFIDALEARMHSIAIV